MCSMANYMGLGIQQRGFFKLPKLLLQIRPSIFPRVFFKGVALLLHPIYPSCNAPLPLPAGAYPAGGLDPPCSCHQPQQHQHVSAHEEKLQHREMAHSAISAALRGWEGPAGGRRPDDTTYPISREQQPTGPSTKKVKMWSR